LLGRAGVPAAVAIALGAVAFTAGLLEPLTLANRKVMFGVSLVLGGLLWQAGSHWRFQHSDDGWFRSLFSVYFLAVLFWTVGLALVVWLGFGRELLALLAKT
jgi:hypothetical protein